MSIEIFEGNEAPNTLNEELIVHFVPIDMDGQKCVLVSLVPGDIDIESLKIRWEDGGLTYRDGKKYPNWEGCRCEVVTKKDLAKKNMLKQSNK